MLTEPRKDIACIYLSSDPNRVDALRERMKVRARELRDFIRWQSGDAYEVVQATGYAFVVDDPGRFGLAGPWNEVESMVREVNPDHEHTYWALFGVFAAGAPRAQPNGIRAVCGSGGRRLARHEVVGHAMMDGGHHATGAVPEYGKPVPDNYGGPTIDGTGNQKGATYLHHAGLIDNRHVGRGNGSYYLVEAATRPRAIPDGAVKIIYLERGGRLYAVSYHEGRVRIDTSRTYASREPTWSAALYIDTLGEGAKWKGVTFARQHQGMAQINCRAWREKVKSIGKRGSLRDLKTLTPAAAASFEGKTGLWYKREWTHQGLALHVLEGRAIAYLFSCTSTGPRWLLLQGPIEGDIARLTVYALGPNTRVRELESVGEVSLHFASDTTGLLEGWIEQADWQWINRIRMPLTRLSYAHEQFLYAFTNTAHAGITVLPPEAGRTVGYWWEDGWRMFDGAAGGDLIVFEPANGMPQTETGSTVSRWGIARLEGERFHYLRDGWTPDNWKVEKLSRLIPEDG